MLADAFRLGSYTVHSQMKIYPRRNRCYAIWQLQYHPLLNEQWDSVIHRDLFFFPINPTTRFYSRIFYH